MVVGVMTMLIIMMVGGGCGGGCNDDIGYNADCTDDNDKNHTNDEEVGEENSYDDNTYVIIMGVTIKGKRMV